MRKNRFMPFANSKGADQPAHLRSLISTFVVLPILYNTSSFLIQNFKTLAGLCSCAGQLESYLVTNSEDSFTHDVAQTIADLSS